MQGKVLHEKRKKKEKTEAQEELQSRFENIINQIDTFSEEDVEIERKFLIDFKESKMYFVNAQNTDIPPHKFDNRNGFFREFKSTTYTKLISILDTRKNFLINGPKEESSEDEEEVVTDTEEEILTDGEDSKSEDEEETVVSGDEDETGRSEDEDETGRSEDEDETGRSEDEDETGRSEDEEEETETDDGGEVIIEEDDTEEETDLDVEVTEDFDTWIRALFCTNLFVYQDIRDKFTDADKLTVKKLYKKLFD